jgi:hypothetical protein
LWRNQPINVLFYCEKDALAEFVYQETAQWDAPLAVVRGQSSKTFLWENAQAIDAENKPSVLYFIGDHDESGDKIIESVIKRVRRYCNTK